MKDEIKELENSLPKNCCSFCTHLTLQLSKDNQHCNIKCVLFDTIPKSDTTCAYFSCENSTLKKEDIDNLYLNFLESCLKINYNDYLDSIHWKLTKQKTLDFYNHRCNLCNSSIDTDVYHKNKVLGRENLFDLVVLCNNCHLNNQIF